MMKKIFLVLSLYCCSLFYLEGQIKFSFVFLADIHYDEKQRASEALDRAIDSINSINSDFVLVGGDMVYDVLRSNQDDAEKLYRAYVAKVARFKVPVHHAIGNHEHFALYNHRIEASHELFGKKMYEKYFGARYYSFDHKGWHFVVLDDMEVTPDRKYVGKVDSIQLAWLKNDLEQVHDTVPVVLMAHVPFITTLTQWYGGGTKANNNRLAIENTDKVLNLFKNKNLRLILQGHIHYFEALDILEKTTVISAPSFSGKWWLGKQHGMEEAFVRIDILDGNRVDYKVIRQK